MVTNAALFFPLFFALTALCVCFQRRYARRHGEWNYLTPGPYYWFGLFSGVLISAVATLVVAGDRVERSSGLLFVSFFAGLTIVLALQGIFHQTRWTRHKIICTTMFRQHREMAWNELSRFGVDWTGMHWISSFDGPRLRFSPYDNGFKQLQAKIFDHIRRNGPPPDPVVTTPLALALAEAGAPRSRRQGS